MTTFTAKELKARWGLGQAAVYRILNAPGFPAPVNQWPRKTPKRWSLASIRKYEKSQGWKAASA